MDGLIAYALAKKYTDKVGQDIISAGFKVQVEEDRSILNRQGEEKVLYLLPKEYGSSQDGYDEFVYANRNWEWVGKTDVSLDYESLENKPQINGVELTGNKTASDLSLQDKLTAGDNITISEENVISARGGVTSYNNLTDKPRIRAWKRNGSSSSFNNLQGILGFEYLDFEYIGAEGDISIKLTDKIFRTYTNTFIGWGYDFNTFASAYAIAGVFWVRNERISNLPSVFTYFDTSNPARSYIFHYFDPVEQTGATVQIIRQVIYLDTNGDTRNFIQLANATKNSDGSYSVSNANGWVELTSGGAQIVSGVVNVNGTITFTDSEGNSFTTSGSNIVTSGNEQISVGYDNGGFYFLFDDGQEGE